MKYCVALVSLLLSGAAAQGTCPNGPLLDTDGNSLFCGRGPGSVVCPRGAFCSTDPLDAFAYCCLNPVQQTCPNGEAPLQNPEGDEIFCGRGPFSVPCPLGSSCFTDPIDRFAFCCPDSPSCPNGVPPLTDANGDVLSCTSTPCDGDGYCYLTGLFGQAICCP